jgi:hypothetical protein
MLKLLAGICVYLFISGPTYAAAIWHEENIARIQVGLEKDKTPIFRVLAIGVLGPDNTAPSGFESAKRCTTNSAQDELSKLRQQLDKIPGDTDIESQIEMDNMDVTPSNVEARVAAHRASFNKTLSVANQDFVRALDSCLNENIKFAEQFRLNFVIRICSKGRNPDCRLEQNRALFEKFIGWFTTKGPVVTNKWVDVAADGRANFLAAPPVEVFTIKERPPEEPEASVLVEQFEQFAIDRKNAGTTMSFVVPALMQLDLIKGRQASSVTNAPGMVLSQMAPSTSAFEHIRFNAQPGQPLSGQAVITATWPKADFANWSDDVARTRIKECANFQGIVGVVQIAACSGYQFDEKHLILCLTGSQCLPGAGSQVYRAIQNIVDKDVGENLITEIPGARIALPNTYGDYLAAASACLDSNRERPELAALCTAKSSASPQDRETIEKCSEAVGRRGDLGACLIVAIKDPTSQQMARCLLDEKSNPKSAFVCAGRNSMPADIRSKIDCLSQMRRSAYADIVLSCKFGGNSAEQQAAIRCLQDNHSEWTGSATCIIAGTKGIPKEVRAGLECATKTGATMSSFAVCAGTKNLPQLPGDLGKLATCAAATGASAVGTAACMAGDHLNRSQQIAIQCAAVAAGIASYAICTGGYLALNEFRSCAGHKFGDDRCFGKNNEIRKFFKNVLHTDISEKTVVAQVLNVPIEVIKFATHVPPLQIAKIGHTRVCFPWC